MFKVAGILLVLLGSTGFSFCLCKEQKKRIGILKDMKDMYQLIQNEIRYTGLPLPDIFRMVSKSVKEPFATALLEIGLHMDRERGECFSEVWKRIMKKQIKKVTLSGEAKKLLLSFPEYCGLFEKEGQAKILERQMRELENWIIQSEKEEKNKNKVIMSLGIATGVFLTVLLL